MSVTKLGFCGMFSRGINIESMYTDVHAAMTKLEIGQQWYNTLHANQPVDIVHLTEQTVMVKTYSGFIYTYDYKQFLDEYTQEIPSGIFIR